jgi:phenylalanyl-tRNA synthetase beta chain
MKFTHNWLKDFVEIKISPQELAQRLTMAGLEVTALGKKDADWVYEVEVTSNRADLLSVIGIAREVAAITGKRLSGYPVIRLSGSHRKMDKPTAQLTIEIQDKKDCLLYTAKIIKNVKVGPSPDWLKRRLELIGCRSVNNIVDITNYVQFSLGQPLHTFDLDKLVSLLDRYSVSPLEIIIRRARDKEEITTIDGIKRSLDKEILVIASNINGPTGHLPAGRQERTNGPTDKPIAIAGIMGGEDTEVTENTTNILLESAQFNPLIIRRARQRLGLSSESSYRFERDIDINSVEPASLYAMHLIIDIAGGQFSLSKSTSFIKTKNKTISLNITRLKDILGILVSSKEIKTILKGLDFKIKVSNSRGLNIEVPSFRKDVNQEIDLIEEIARIWGYERIPLSIPAIKPSLKGLMPFKLIKIIKETLVAQGLNEVITYSLISKDILKKADLDQKAAIEIVNPLSNQQEVLRPQLSPSLLIAISKNINQEDSVSVFEIAKVFKVKGEELSLGIGLCGERWLHTSSGRVKDSLGPLHLKGIIEILFERLGIKDYDFILENQAYFKNGQAIKLKIKQEDIGYLGEVNREVSESFDIKNRPAFLSEICLDKIFSFANLKKTYKPLALYPSVRRDISLVVKDEIAIRDILSKAIENAPLILKEIKVIDCYKGRQIPANFKGVTLTFLYLSDERTLTDEEVNIVHNKICDLLKKEFLAQIR